MAAINLIVRVAKRVGDEGAPYALLRNSTVPGEVVEAFPATQYPGLDYLVDDQWRILRVTGTAMTQAIGDMLAASDVLNEADVGRGFQPRARLYRLLLHNLPATTLAQLANRTPYDQRGVYHDLSITYTTLAAYIRRKAGEPRDAQALPVDDNESMGDL